MRQTSLQFCSMRFRHKGFVWLMLIVFCLSFVPSVSFAQQPTATISALNGTALVNGQAANRGAVLYAGDVIETQAGTSVVLVLSDGSQLELGENTRLDLAELSQTATGARVSRVKMAWGWLRAKLSPGHQKEGSSFDIETPNALVGVKFSPPDVVVSYNPEKQETVALAYTVALSILNLITNERIMVPVGSSAIITMTGIQVVAGLVEAGAISAAETAGMGTGTKVAIGAGALAAAGGVTALVIGGGDSGGSKNFTGIFKGYNTWQNSSWTKIFDLEQHSDGSITGTFEIDEQEGDCVWSGRPSVQGKLTGENTAAVYPDNPILPAPNVRGCYDFELPNPFNLTLRSGGDILTIENWGIDLYRQE